MPSPSPGPRATSFADLDPRYEARYHHMLTAYYQDLQQYKNQQRELSALRSWVMSTVVQDYRKITCDPTQSIRVWYQGLRDFVKLDLKRVLINATHAYNKAIVPLTTPPKDFVAWLNNWTSVMADLTAHHSPIAQHPHLWLDGFLTAIRSVKPQWETVWNLEFWSSEFVCNL